MAASAWKLFYRAKRNLGAGNIVLTTGAVLKLSLHRTSASANLLTSIASIFSEVGSEINAAAGYTTGGKALPNVKWTISGSTMRFTFSSTGLAFTATGSALSAIRYAVIRTSIGATSGRVICYCALSTAAFDLAVPNTLTIIPAAGGVFTLT